MQNTKEGKIITEGYAGHRPKGFSQLSAKAAVDALIHFVFAHTHLGLKGFDVAKQIFAASLFVQ